MPSPGKTLMTEQDMKDAGPIAADILDMLRDQRPPKAVAAAAFALAGMAHLAECGPEAARHLFDYYYAELERKKGT